MVNTGKGSVTGRSQPTGAKPTMRERKLRNGVYWQGALKKKCVKEMGRKIRATCIGSKTSHSALVHHKSHMTWPGTEPRSPQ